MLKIESFPDQKNEKTAKLNGTDGLSSLMASYAEVLICSDIGRKPIFEALRLCLRSVIRLNVEDKFIINVPRKAFSRGFCFIGISLCMMRNKK